MKSIVTILGTFLVMICVNTQISAQVFTTVPDSISKIPLMESNDPNSVLFEWVDYDNDNDYDFIIAGKNKANNQYNTVLYENINGVKFIPVDTFNISGSIYHIELGDIDNDNDIDIILNSSSGNIFMKNNLPINLGYSVLFNSCVDSVFLNSCSLSKLSNFLNDGKESLNSIKVVGMSYRMELFRNKFSTSCGFDLVDSVNYSVAGIPISSDFNNDGYLDLLRYTYYNIIGYYANNGIGSMTKLSFVPQNFSNYSFTSINSADINNDGLLDLTVSGSSPIVHDIYFNNGNHTFIKKLNGGISDTIGGALFPFDFNNDGKIDILTIRKFGINQA